MRRCRQENTGDNILSIIKETGKITRNEVMSQLQMSKTDLWKLNNDETKKLVLHTKKELENSFEEKEKLEKVIEQIELLWEKILIEGNLDKYTMIREFDPGSGWTLAACITHSSRTVKGLRSRISGGRVSNAWATCLCVWNNTGKLVLIPHNALESHGSDAKEQLHIDGLASD